MTTIPREIDTLAELISDRLADRAERKLITVEEAAERLSISRPYAYELVMANPPRLRSMKLGRRRLIPVDALDEFIETEMSRTSAMSGTEGAATNPARGGVVAR